MFASSWNSPSIITSLHRDILSLALKVDILFVIYLVCVCLSCYKLSARKCQMFSPEYRWAKILSTQLSFNHTSRSYMLNTRELPGALPLSTRFQKQFKKPVLELKVIPHLLLISHVNMKKRTSEPFISATSPSLVCHCSTYKAVAINWWCAWDEMLEHECRFSSSRKDTHKAVGFLKSEWPSPGCCLKRQV